MVINTVNFLTLGLGDLYEKRLMKSRKHQFRVNNDCSAIMLPPVVFLFPTDLASLPKNLPSIKGPLIIQKGLCEDAEVLLPLYKLSTKIKGLNTSRGTRSDAPLDTTTICSTLKTFTGLVKTEKPFIYPLQAAAALGEIEISDFRLKLFTISFLSDEGVLWEQKDEVHLS